MRGWRKKGFISQERTRWHQKALLGPSTLGMQWVTQPQNHPGHAYSWQHPAVTEHGGMLEPGHSCLTQGPSKWAALAQVLPTVLAETVWQCTAAWEPSCPISYLLPLFSQVSAHSSCSNSFPLWAFSLTNALDIYRCATNYYQISGLKPHIFIISQLWGNQESRHGITGSSATESFTRLKSEGWPGWNRGWGLIQKFGWGRITFQFYVVLGFSSIEPDRLRTSVPSWLSGKASPPCHVNFPNVVTSLIKSL